MQTEHLSYPIATDIAVTLCSAVLLSTFLRYFKIPTILIYLITGILIGPTGIALVADFESIRVIAEFGIVFLLFTLGLEFSPPKILAVKRFVFGLGSIQVGVCFLLFFSVILAYNINTQGTALCAIVLALSSTAIVSKELTQLHLLKSRPGQICIGILLFQDLVAILALSLLPLWTASQASSAWDQTVILIKAGTFLSIAMFIGRRILPTLFTEIAKARSQELFILTALAVAVTSALITQWVGLSMSIGAFIAGMLLGESHYRHQIEADIRPFRDILLGLFFISVGMLMDLKLLEQYWLRMLFFTSGMILLKIIITATAVLLFKESKRIALQSGILLAQGGEFGFVLLALGAYHELIPRDVASFTLAIIIFSMMISSMMIRHCDTLLDWAARKLPGLKALAIPPPDKLPLPKEPLHDHVIVLGYGRVGQSIGRFLAMENIPFIAIDDDVQRVHTAITAGESVIYGDASQYQLLEHMGLSTAKLLIISFDNVDTAQTITQHIRTHNTTLPILVRTRDNTNLDALTQAGVTEVIPEILEASLMLVSQILLRCQVPPKRIHTLLTETRQAHYRQLDAFYQGTDLPKAATAQAKACLYPIVIPEKSIWVGQTLTTLQSHLKQVTLEGIKHRTQQKPSAPAEIMHIEAYDTLILRGLNEHLEQAETELTREALPKP